MMVFFFPFYFCMFEEKGSWVLLVRITLSPTLRATFLNNNNNKNTANHTSPNASSNSVDSNEPINSNSNSGSNNFDFSNIDMNTIMKIKSVMEQMNNNNDPRSNLLQSLKPYLRDSKKEKLDQYANLINIAKVAELFKNDNKETPNNG